MVQLCTSSLSFTVSIDIDSSYFSTSYPLLHLSIFKSVCQKTTSKSNLANYYFWSLLTAQTLHSHIVFLYPGHLGLVAGLAPTTLTQPLLLCSSQRRRPRVRLPRP